MIRQSLPGEDRSLCLSCHTAVVSATVNATVTVNGRGCCTVIPCPAGFVNSTLLAL